MRLLIRADASSGIGAGHVMRCFALAQAWRRQGGSCVFVARELSATLQDFICGQGFEVEMETVAPEQWSKWQPDWVALDGYLFGTDCHTRIRNAGYRLLVLDDEALLGTYHCDLVLNQNAHGTELPYHLTGRTRLLAGLRYTMLREDFLLHARPPREFHEQRCRILVTMGGADPANLTPLVLQALAETELEALVIAGSDNARLFKLVALSAAAGDRIQVISSASDMADRMAWADLAITAGGSTCWEMAFMGLPSIIIVAASNQRGVADAAEKAGAARNLGWHSGVTPAVIRATMMELAPRASLRREMSAAGCALIDGSGADRVVEAMLSI